MKGLSVAERLLMITPREQAIKLLEMRVMELRILWDKKMLNIQGRPERDILRLNEHLLLRLTGKIK